MKSNLRRASIVAAVALGAPLAFGASSAVAVPSGCTAYVLGEYGIRVACTTAASGYYFRGVASCHGHDKYGNQVLYTRYGQWIWQGATAVQYVYCDNFDAAYAANAQVS
ncbi:MAG: hypothetical protein ACXVXW_15320 [Mycobacteriaceae bacterium]